MSRRCGLGSAWRVCEAKFLITVEKVNDVTKQLEFAIVPHISATQSRTELIDSYKLSSSEEESRQVNEA